MELWWLYTLIGLGLGGVIVFIFEQWEQTQASTYIAQTSKRLQKQRLLIDKALLLRLPYCDPTKESATRFIYQLVCSKQSFRLEDLKEATLSLQSHYQNQSEAQPAFKHNFPEHSVLRLEPLEFWQLLLIINESLENAVQHAAAAYIFNIVSFEDDHLNIITHDNGVGYDRLQVIERMGITEIRAAVASLGGHLKLTSTLGNGTVVNAAIPMKSAKALFKSY